MAFKAPVSLITALHNKQVEYTKSVTVSQSQVVLMQEQITLLKGVAITDTIKSNAIQSALEILSKADVVI